MNIIIWGAIIAVDFGESAKPYNQVFMCTRFENHEPKK